MTEAHDGIWIPRPLLSFLVLGLFSLMSAVARGDVDVNNIAVVQTDPTILQPGEPFDLNGKSVVFTPKPGGGYTASVTALDFDSDQGSNLGLGDDDSRPEDLLFNFPFYGTDRSTVFINSNGNLTFDSADEFTFHFNQVYGGGGVGALFTPPGDAFTVLFDFALSVPRIAPLWQDLNPAAGSGTVNLRSAADRLVVTWNNVRLFGTTTSLTFQVILFANGDIHFNYKAVGNTPGGGYLIGLSPGNISSLGPFGVTTVDFSQGGQTVSNEPDGEALAQVFGTTAAPLVHINAVARRFYSSHSDDHDQLVMFANFGQAMGGAFAFELSPKNDVSGIGVDTYDFAPFFGSASRLQSFVNMNRLGLYPSSPITNVTGLGTNNTLDVLGQEAGHRWAAFVQFDNGSGQSDELLGRGLAHWSFFLDSDASDMEGNDWQDNNNGSFTSTEATARYSPLDQYLMGLRSAAATPDFFFIDNPSAVNCPVLDFAVDERSCAPKVGVTVSGQRQDISLDDVVRAEGPRSPSSGFSGVNATNTWRQAFILLVKTASAPSTDLSKIGKIRDAWVPYFNAAVDGLGNVGAILPGGEPALKFSSANFNVNESGAAATITVTRSGSTAETVSVDYATSDGTAAAGDDYAATSGSLIFNSGQTSRTFTIPIVNDSLDETNEIVNLTLSNPSGDAILDAQSSATLTILDDDTAGTVQFSAATYSVNETGVSVTITVNRSGGAASGATVDFATSNGTALAGADYTATSGTLTFGTGETTKTFAITISNDGLAEGNETVNLSLSNPGGGAILGARSTAVLTIVDDEIAIGFAAANFSAGENSGGATITVLRSGPANSTVTVDYATSDGTATAGSDYGARTATLTFLPGQASRSFTIPIVNDTLDEDNETVNLTLSNPTGGAQLGSQNTAVLTIGDNDAGGVLQFSAANYSVNEGALSGKAAVKVTRTGGSASGVTVDYLIADGTAISGTDYNAANGTLMFNAGQTSKSFTIDIINDLSDEPNKTVNLTLVDPPQGGAILGARSTAVLTIVNNDIANVRGLYTVPGGAGSSLTLSACTTIPGLNDTFDVNGSINISSQSGRNFSGTSTLFFTDSASTTYRIAAPLSGKVAPGGEQLSGTFSFNVKIPPNATVRAKGTGTFSGVLSGDTLTFTPTGQTNSGDTCQLTGTLIGTR